MLAFFAPSGLHSARWQYERSNKEALMMNDFSQQAPAQPEARTYYQSLTENKVHTAITVTAGGVLGHYVVAPAVGWLYKKVKLLFADDKK